MVVFMSDGLRWDFHPEAVREMGITIRTIASSLHTPSSIASMLTGRYLPNHEIRGFTDQLSEDQSTILDAFDNSAVSAESGNFNNEIYGYLLNRYNTVKLSHVEEPFAWFMRDPGGHAPLDGFNEDLSSTESVRSYFRRKAGNRERLRTDYQRAVNSSVKRFRSKVLEPLQQRGIISDTLIVFISDHGELLGEYGHVGESHPASPELVKVPTTFIHPDLPAREETKVMRHVDLPATVTNLGDLNELPFEGDNALVNGHSDCIGLNFYDRPYPSFRGAFHYTLSSVWNWRGGHVFNRSSLWSRLKLVGGYVTRIPAGIHLRRSRNLRGVKLLLDSHYSWGNPGFNETDAEEMLDMEIVTAKKPNELDLDDAARENLKDLGYL